MNFTTAEITAWIGSLLWPFLRISAMLLAAPLYGAGTVTVRVRLAIAFILALVVAPLIPLPPAVEPLSLAGLVVSVQQILIGLTIGFVLQMVFAALTQAGEAIALSMGLGFASMVDPQSGVQVPVVSSYFVIMSTLLFLALNGHVALIELTLLSFQALPVGVEGVTREGLWALVSWGSTMFLYALLVALPAVASMLLVNLSMGVITRAAPQLNIFAVGFPMMIMLGFILLLLTTPVLLPKFTELLASGFDLMGILTRQ
ncbi:flagellar biosynthetic protein FliR [Thioalkalivibrio sulfidiphilus]|uniref:Flagellar biosynthetic protein FliR n=1 Tax=Thioalkalivibrio sulfidiphilus (strain HL-EbGR7) TaxID=396588 RepID=B8GQZ8_THISH|nr:flagellar biosynthetic protein FliR [Thioalkalivibrio sulfidiphilus]ACL72418.1 flagellar biosynthetic protein FliR [Thioalkalivibrio sulfidiphilus HL-EbGr7]